MRRLTCGVSGPALAVGLISCHDQTSGPSEGALALSANSHDFGEVAVGQPTTPFALTVTNTGSRTTGQVAAGFTTLTDQFQLEKDACSGRMLAPAASCHIEVTMRTGAVGPAEAVLSLVSGGSDDSAFATFQGLVFHSEISVTNPEAGDVGHVDSGTVSPPRTLNVKNLGEVATGALQDYWTGPDPAKFETSQDGCVGQSLPPGQTCTVVVKFFPQSHGTKRAYIFMQSPGAGTILVVSGDS